MTTETTAETEVTWPDGDLFANRYDETVFTYAAAREIAAPHRRGCPARTDQGERPVTTKQPTPQAISALLRKAAYDRSEIISRATLNHRHTAGFHVRGDKTAVYVGWRPAAPLVTPSAAQVERNKARALELAGEYAEAIKTAGWTAEVIHLAGPLVRVTAKES